MQEVKTLSCWSRFATRCLKLRGPAKSGRGKRKQSAVVKLPGEDLVVDEDGDESYPFSDTEEEVAAMDPKHRALHADVHRRTGGDHASPHGQFEVLYYDTRHTNLIDGCFKAAVGRLLPEHSSDFEFHVMSSTGAHVQFDERAYISYTPCKATAEYESYNINVPVGDNSTLTTLTAVPTLSDAQRASVNAAFAVLVDRLGLTAVGEPGFKLVSTTSDG